MFCNNCGAKIEDGATFCPMCGAGQQAANSQPTQNCAQGQSQQTQYQQPQPIAAPDASSFGYAVLGFFVPLVGLILFLMWKDATPLRAKSAGKGALISVILNVVFGVVGGIFYVVLFAGALSAAGGGAGYFLSALASII